MTDEFDMNKPESEVDAGQRELGADPAELEKRGAVVAKLAKAAHLLREDGFEITYTGVGDEENAESELDYPHILAWVTAVELVANSCRCAVVLGPEWEVRGMYDANSGNAVVMAALDPEGPDERLVAAFNRESGGASDPGLKPGEMP